MAKKLLIAFGILFGILLALIIALPFFINVDQYRPEIQKQAQNYINGTLTLGKLKLSLWGQIRIEVDGVKLTDAAGKEVVTVKDAFFHLPFSSVLSGSPELTFKMNKPEVNVIKEKDGVLNLQKIHKVSAEPQAGASAAAPQTQAQSGDQAATSGTVELPAIVARSRLSIELKDALVLFTDPSKDLKNKLENFNISLTDISLTKTMKIKIWADLNTTLSKQLSVEGPFEVNAQVEVKIKNQKFDFLTAEAQVNLDGLSVKLPGVFHKKKGSIANVSSKIKATANDFFIESILLNFINAKIAAQGELKNYTAKESSQSLLKFEVKSDPIDLAPWAELAEGASGYEVSGTLVLNADVFGPLSELQANALLEIQKLMAKTPGLKVKPEMNLLVSVKSDEMDRFVFDFKAPKNEIKLNGSIKSLFKAPTAVFQLQSSGLDLNELVVLPDPKKSSASEPATSAAAPSQVDAKGGDSAKNEDKDAQVDPLRKNDFLRKVSGSLDAQIKFIKVYDITLDQILSKVTFKDLVFAIQNFQFQVFKGKIAAKTQIDFKPQAPAYQLFAEVNGLDTKTAMESKLELFKNTIAGKLNFKAQGNGRSFNTEAAIKNLDLKGTFIFSDAKFTTIDIGKMVVETVNGSLAKVQEKVPQLKGKQLKSFSGRESRYDQIASNFSIKNGVFNAPDFTAKSVKGSGVDLRGNSTLNLISQDINAEWSIIDTHNTTGVEEISVNLAGQEVPRILAEKGQAVRFPVSIGCKATAPCVDSKEVPVHFIKVATQNIAGAGKAVVTNKAKEEVKKVIQNNPELQKAAEKAPEPAKKLLKKFGF